MYLNQITKTNNYNTRFNINHQAFLHIVPDFNSTVPDVLNNLNINLSNCQALYVKNSTIKFGTKSINPKYYFYALKQKEDFDLNLMSTMPTKINDNKFIIVDHTILSQGCQQILELTQSVKQTTSLMFNNLKSEFNSLKTRFPTVENVLLFNLSSIDIPNLYEIISNLRGFENNLDMFKVFDNWCLVSVSAAKEKTSYIPLMGFDGKGKVEIFFPNLTKIHSALANIEPIQPEIIQTAPEKKSSAEEITKKLTDSITHKATKTQDDLYKTTTEIDKKKLSSALKHFKVRDPIVANNIKVSIDKYLKQNPEVTQKEDLEDLVLKSIHYSLFNDENIKDEYIADPNRLISKLTEMNNHAVNLDYPEPTHNPQIVSPQDIIDIHKITGLDRHKYEFGENLDFNVHNLFKSLESRKQAPVKILDIKSQIKDNNLDRVKEYTITVQNLTGDLKDPYELKLRIPSLINDRYFKLNGQSYINF